MRTRMSLRLAIGVASALFGAVGCGPAPAGSSAPTSPSASAAASPIAAASPSPLAAVLLWPAPPDPMERTVQAGLKPQPKEFFSNHVHAHLDVFVDGKPVTVPAGIGIKIDNPAVRRFDEPDGSVAYGGIDLCNEGCISPLHTHDASGILHTESADSKRTRLESCSSSGACPSMCAWRRDVLRPGHSDRHLCRRPANHRIIPRAIELTNQREIAIVIGTPPPEIPKTADFSKA